jgi:VWFA-related protein
MKRVPFLAVLLASLVTIANSEQTESPKDQSRPPQTKSSKDEPVRISVTLVQVDAVVTDSKGHQVTDLKPEDFEILEDGRPQRITNFSYISSGGSRPEAEAGRRPDKLAPPLPAARLLPDQVRRTIAVVVDDLDMSFVSMAYTREALKKFVGEQMEPGDLVAIIRTGAGIGALQQFTTDKRQLCAAIDHLRWNLIGSGVTGVFQPIPSDPGWGSTMANGRGAGRARHYAQDEMDEFRQQIFSVGTLGAVGYVVRGLTELPGRKSLVLVSDGFGIFDADGRVREAMRVLTDLANRACVVIYCLDARGLGGLSAADGASWLSVKEVQDRLFDRNRDYYETRESLIYLAKTTGGLAVTNNNDLASAIHRFLDDQKGYYLIGYIPDDSTFKPVAGRRVFHKLAVKVSRPGLRVRSRAGFYGAEDEQAYPAPRTPQQQLTAALTSPFGAGDIRLKLTALFGNTPGSSYVRSLMNIDLRDLTFTSGTDGTDKAVLDIVAITFGDNGSVVDQVSRTDTISVKTEALKRVLDHGLLYELTLPVKRPGGYQLRVAVRDAVSARVGSASQFVAVPDLTKGRLALSGIALSGMDSAIGEAASRVTQAGGTNASGGLDKTTEGAQTGDNTTKTGTALRVFRRGKDLDYVVIIYNARLDKTSLRPQLESEVRLFKDGIQVYASGFSPVQLSADHQDDWKRIDFGGSMHLTRAQEPGQYALQIVIVDKLAREKYRTATQWIDFEVAE